MEKLNCNIGNYQCGGKCQSNKNKCPKKIGNKESSELTTFTKIIKKSNKSEPKYPHGFEDKLKNLDEDFVFDKKIEIQQYIKELAQEDPDLDYNIKNRDKKIKNGMLYYIMDGYHNINPMVRNPNNIDNISEDDLAILKIVLDDFNALDNYNGNNGNLFRGDSPHKDNKNLKIGDTFVNKGLLSTTSDPEIANFFENGVIYEIKPKQESNAKNVNFSNEKEVIYNDNQEFKVIDIIKLPNNKIKYILEEI